MWSCFQKMSWNVLKFVIFLIVQIFLEEMVDLIFSRGTLRFISAQAVSSL